MSLSDAEILIGSAAGDERAVVECIDRFGPLVLAMARQTLADPVFIDDAVQEVMVEIWKCSGRFDPAKGSARTFVATIAKRRLIDQGRMAQARIRGVITTDVIDPAARRDEGPTPASREEAARAADCINAMNEPQREIVRLSLGEGWSHQRIADHLAMPLGTIKTILRRALGTLRESLGGSVASPRGPFLGPAAVGSGGSGGGGAE